MTPDNKVLESIKSNFIKEFKGVIGNGNLLEVLHIFLGSFQNAVVLNRQIDYIDHRNHLHWYAPYNADIGILSSYLNKQYSLQGLFLIYEKAYKLLKEGNDRNSKKIISQIYDIVKKSELKESAVGKQLKLGNVETGLDLLNTLANPDHNGKVTFKTEQDFENNILVHVRNLLNNCASLNNDDIQSELTQYVVDTYYSIHKDIKTEKDLMLSLCKPGKNNSSLDKLMLNYIKDLSKPFNGIILRKICETNNEIDHDVHYPGIYTKKATQKYALKCLLEDRDSSKFEELVTDHKNIVYYYNAGETNKVTDILCLAVLSGDVNMASNLIKDAKQNVHAVDQNGDTLLHLAVLRTHDIKMVRFLLENGANPLKKDRNSKLPSNYVKEDNEIKKLLTQAENRQSNTTDITKACAYLIIPAVTVGMSIGIHTKSVPTGLLGIVCVCLIMIGCVILPSTKVNDIHKVNDHIPKLKENHTK
jgi:hypothetical protein